MFSVFADKIFGEVKNNLYLCDTNNLFTLRFFTC